MAHHLCLYMTVRSLHSSNTSAARIPDRCPTQGRSRPSCSPGTSQTVTTQSSRNTPCETLWQIFYIYLNSKFIEDFRSSLITRWDDAGASAREKDSVDKDTKDKSGTCTLLRVFPFSATLYFYSITSQRKILYFLLHYINLICLVANYLADLDH